jgi:hypothetical protein
MPVEFDVSDKVQIMECMHRYSWGYDSKDVAMLRGCFAADATADIYIKGKKVLGPYHGRDAIVEYMSGYMNLQTDQRRHSITNIIFDETSNQRAVVRSFLVLTAVNGDEVKLVTTGWYRTTMTSDAGSWRISELELFLDAGF